MRGSVGECHVAYAFVWYKKLLYMSVIFRKSPMTNKNCNNINSIVWFLGLFGCTTSSTTVWKMTALTDTVR